MKTTQAKTPFNTLPEAIKALRQGQMVLLVDDEHRENEGDFILPAEKVTPEAIAFMLKFGSGIICTPMQRADLKRLNIPMMVEQNASCYKTAFTVSVGAARNITTGISAHDRAETIRVLANTNSKPSDIVMPGHIFPLCADPLGVLGRAGHTEGTIDLLKMAGLKPRGVLCEVMNADGTMARLPELLRFAKKHRLVIISIADIIAHRLRTETHITELSSATLPLEKHGLFTLKVFDSALESQQSIALIRGHLKKKPVLVRIHSECVTGDLFGSMRCDCGWQIQSSLEQIAEQGGVLLYLRQEGRGIGLSNKIKAYSLQEKGMDTVEANQHLGFSADQRDYAVAAQILRHLGIKKVNLLTNNLHKVGSLQHYGIDVVQRVSLESTPTEHNLAYLKTKRDKLGHVLDTVHPVPTSSVIKNKE